MNPDQEISADANADLAVPRACLIVFVGLFLVLICVPTVFSYFGDDRGPVAAPPNHSWAEKLAVIDNGSMDTSGAGTIQYWLDELRTKFPTESEQRIADMVCLAQDKLAAKGRRMRICDILAEVNYSVPDGVSGVTLVEVMGAYVTFTKSTNRL